MAFLILVGIQKEAERNICSVLESNLESSQLHLQCEEGMGGGAKVVDSDGLPLRVGRQERLPVQSNDDPTYDGSRNKEEDKSERN